ncbi:DMT family transporter [Lyticum sinuosum]|uniref:S-adenosylmethionine uptake transporter n=1 Tax=Lyticum sinuosum TaxID=1332059 RepID=A0AAE5AH93_9RICK|nr:DMT family transporter [Lyticum sinuosum]MDZ5761310.1 EamA family transporter [Lyticum sinuosum]
MERTHEKIKSIRSTRRGIILMIIHAIAMSILYVISKKLTKIISPEQVAFLYKLGVFVIAFPWYLAKGLYQTIKTNVIHWHFARGGFSLLATIFFYKAIQSIKVADAAAITYLENILVMLVGVFFFKEKFSLSKIIIAICGITGALLIIKPGFESFSSSYIYIMYSLVFWMCNNIVVKVLGKTEKTHTQLFYSSLFGSILAIPMIIGKNWNGIELWYNFQYIPALAVLHAIHVIAFFRSFKAAEISTVMPFDYSRLIFTGILGYCLFNEKPDAISLLGYFIICFGGIYSVYNETVLK